MEVEVITWMQLLANAGLLVVGWLIGSYFPAYFSEKGRNRATKEDIEAITKKIEDVKAALGSRLHIHQIRYEHEFKILMELSEKLVAVRDATLTLRPEAGYGDPNDLEEKKKRVGRYLDAGRELYTFMETRQPFYPENLYQAMKLFDQATWKEVVQYKHQTPDQVPGYWDNALKNGAQIGTISSLALQLIRERARQWEKFDPGP
jgi:hypothetical protein